MTIAARPQSGARVTSTVRVSPIATAKAPAIPVRVQSVQPRRIAAMDVQDPHRLARMLDDMQTAVVAATSIGRSDPISGGVLFQGVPTTSGVTLVLRHNLGRSWLGYFVTRSYGAVVGLADGVLPGGLLPGQAIALLPSATGKIDVRVF